MIEGSSEVTQSFPNTLQPDRCPTDDCPLTLSHFLWSTGKSAKTSIFWFPLPCFYNLSAIWFINQSA